jgi:hypothetical protein
MIPSNPVTVQHGLLPPVYPHIPVLSVQDYGTPIGFSAAVHHTYAPVAAPYGGGRKHNGGSGGAHNRGGQNARNAAAPGAADDDSNETNLIAKFLPPSLTTVCAAIIAAPHLASTSLFRPSQMLSFSFSLPLSVLAV